MFTISSTPLEELDLKADLQDSAAGALVTFEGWVRDHNDGRLIRQLEYQAYEALASKEGTRVLEEVETRFEIICTLRGAGPVQRRGWRLRRELTCCPTRAGSTERHRLVYTVSATGEPPRRAVPAVQGCRRHTPT